MRINVRSNVSEKKSPIIKQHHLVNHSHINPPIGLRFGINGNNKIDDVRLNPIKNSLMAAINRQQRSSKINNNNNNKNSFFEKNRQSNIINAKPNAMIVKRINDSSGVITPELRKLLRPTVIGNKLANDEKKLQQQNSEVEDLNGPYNFRKLLRPAEYLPTESLRKRKSGSGYGEIVPITIKDKVPGKNNLKRRAPLAPNNNKIIVNRH